MSQTAILGRDIILRGQVSLYLSIDADWVSRAGLDMEDTCRLQLGGVEDGALTVTLFIDQDYSDSDNPPGQFDIDPVDVQTDIQWCLPSDIRHDRGITGEFGYNAEYLGDGRIEYRLVSPSARDDRLLA
ncbi:hypothetical protein ACOZ4F_00395 (plasmid) [Haloarcula marismortui]|nr:hypothetical protein [Haloarcula sp. Atlit-47R]RLM41292.1 hypothetical protein DVK00_20100 [Haloarcula sp. Atlit-47R]